MVSKNVNKRRIYIDIQEDTVYSANTQYGGNTIGLKKLAMRLGINKAAKEGWLTEHMFISGIKGPGGRVTYFAGAFPSMCGKTSTAMIPGETIIGDDIAYIREIDGKAKGVNVEKGLFGIIQDINDKDDTIIWDVINNPNEVIFSNILVTEDKRVHWIGKPGEMPEKGINFAGEWWPGKKGVDGNEIPPSHKNARFTTSIASLSNRDERYNDPAGVTLDGLVYGGRDSDTWVPVFESYDWVHGIVAIGASLESETTAATLGKTGVRTFNPMSNLDFLSIPFGEYIKINIDFGKKIDNPPKIFGVNYFLKGKDGEFLNSKLDKRVWLKWAELRTHGEVEAIDIGIGLIPEYQDLKRLFNEVLDTDYSEQDYVEQFTLRVDENISKIERIIKTYEGFEEGAPGEIFDTLRAQKARLEEIKAEKGNYISPESFK
jgi:phosphoenolpyruvate carboxykinase (GTP)